MISIITAMITIGLFAFLIPMYGLLGAVLSYGIGVLLNNIIRSLYVFFTLKIHPFSVPLAKSFMILIISLLAGGASRAIVQDANDIAPVILISVVSLVAFAGMTILNVNKDDRFILQAIRQKIKK